MTSAIWIAVGLGLVAVPIAVIVRTQSRKADLGSVSDHWIAEQRAEKTLDPR